jgi:hypothetical protein
MMPRKGMMLLQIAAIQYIQERSLVWIPREAARAMPKPTALVCIRSKFGKRKEGRGEHTKDPGP